MNLHYTSLLATIPLALTASGLETKKVAKQPNILIIMADEWRADAIGFQGKEPVKTPSMDRLAKQSVVFANAVSHYPVSSPARAQLMTGMFPLDNKVINNCNSLTAPMHVELEENALCWSDVLKNENYSLGYIGKWHLDAPHTPYIDCSNNRGSIAWNEWCPPTRRHGFDFWLAYGTYDDHLRPMYWTTEAQREEFRYVNQWGPEYEADQAIAFLKNTTKSYRREEQPFALVVSMNPPHMGYHLVPQRYKDLYTNLNVDSLANAWPNVPPADDKMGRNFRQVLKNYYACITGVDENIGRIVNALDSLGMRENTIVIITSDHGDCMGMNGQQTKNVIYEHSMRIPLMIRYPHSASPKREETMISLMDLYPTMLSLAGLSNRIGPQVQGIDYSRLITEGKGKYPSSQPYFKYSHTDLKEGYRGVRTDRYSYCLTFQSGKITDTLLIDRKADPYMLKNIARSAGKNVYKKLNRELKQWLIRANDPLAESICP